MQRERRESPHKCLSHSVCRSSYNHLETGPPGPGLSLVGVIRCGLRLAERSHVSHSQLRGGERETSLVARSILSAAEESVGHTTLTTDCPAQSSARLSYHRTQSERSRRVESSGNAGSDSVRLTVVIVSGVPGVTNNADLIM